MSKVKGIFRLFIAPFKDKFKLQMRVNTLELQKRELEMTLQSRVSETIINALTNQEEVDRLRKENVRLRVKVKQLKGEK